MNKRDEKIFKLPLGLRCILPPNKRHKSKKDYVRVKKLGKVQYDEQE